MVTAGKERAISDFAIAFSIEFRSYMEAHGITQVQLADALNRTQPYVSKALRGKRPLDTDDVDALARLTDTTGRSLMIELARLTKEQLRQRNEVGSVADQFAKITGRKADYSKAAYRDENKKAESGRGEDVE